MVTFVGTQARLSTALQRLIELDYEAVEAYEAAIERLENDHYKKKLSEFRDDHKRHIKELSQIMKDRHETPPTGPTLTKMVLTKGKVILANLIGDKVILKAMRSNEIDTNTAYERMNVRDDVHDALKAVLHQGLKDEQKHKAWLESETNT